MGMAASQARFLGLTARKTNTEYEGQQVNQQRTALANQSANLYNKLLTMTVPTPPDTTDFYNMRYTYNVGYDEYEIVEYSSSDAANDNYPFDVRVRHTFDEQQAFMGTTANGQINDNQDGTYTINVGGNDTAVSLVTGRENLAEELGLQNSNFYSYTTDANDGQTYYIPEDTFNGYFASGNTVYNGTIDRATYATVRTSEYETLNSVQFTVDASGNFTDISIEDGGTYSLTTESVQDDAGYELAMNTYTQEKNLYDREVANINAQTEVLQQQDKTLELRLKQLDSEQNALQTEMEAVTKVIEKNIESTFKTFA